MAKILQDDAILARQYEPRSRIFFRPSVGMVLFVVVGALGGFMYGFLGI